MRRLLLLLVIGLLASTGTALAVDMDNNGIDNDETYVPGTFIGNPDLDEVVMFPTSADTWQVAFYPYWWNVGDTVYGTHNVNLSTVSHVDLALKISYNVLQGSGHVDLDFRLNGTTVGSFSVLPSDGTGFVYQSFDFSPIAPPLELRYYETNQVASGMGSISMDETGLCTATFTGGGTPTEASTWGRVKALFRN
jgi:hypothetical protein